MDPLRIVSVLSFVVLLAGPVGAQHHEHGEHAGHGGAPVPMAAAPDLASAWAELRGLRDAIAGDVEAGRLSEIHAKSERLAPLAKTLLDRSTDLAPDKRARAEAAVKQIPKVADSLHGAADKGDAGATRRELGRLDGVLELIRAQYPADALAAASAHGEHEGHSQAAPAASPHAHGAAPMALVDAPPAATLRVKASEFDFQPRTLQLRAGEATRIEFENDGATEHSLVVKAPDGTSDWIHLHAASKAKDVGTYRIEQPGQYPLLCTIAGHTEAGMVGLVVVKK
jgi:plastocyanin